MIALILTVAIGSAQVAPLELSLSAPKRPWVRDVVFKFGDQSEPLEYAAFEAGLLFTQGNRFVLLAASDGHVVWDVNCAFQDPPASVGTPQAFRFGHTVVFSEQRQGHDYVTALTALDLRTGVLRWHRAYPTTVFNSAKVGRHLMTAISENTREVSLADGSLLPIRAQPKSVHSGDAPIFPYGRPVSVQAWHGGFLGYYDYEDSEMYSGEMRGVNGLAFVKLEDGKWMDAWGGKWMTRMKGHLKNPSAIPVWRDVFALDRLAWVLLNPHWLGGIDEAGKLVMKIPLSQGISPVLTSDGILYTSDGWIWRITNGRSAKIRRLSPEEGLFESDGRPVTPIGLLILDKRAINDPEGTCRLHVSITRIYPAQK